MRKVVLLLHSSLDGKVQGPAPWDLGWVSYGPDLEQYAASVLSEVTTVVWGRVTYEGMQSHWTAVPTNPDSTDYERRHAVWLDSTEKVVASTTLDRSDWINTRFIAKNLPEEIRNLKRESGGHIAVLGSPSVGHTLMQHDLIDEYRLTVSPVVLGAGLDLFLPGVERQVMSLEDSTAFPSGLLALNYRRQR